MKMTERERLIELLDSGCYEALSKCKGENKDKKLCEFLADFLLESGVRVPPVVVGTTVSACDNIEVIGNIHDNPELME